MARIRTIKPDFWKHEDLSDLPEATHMLAAALLNYADDHGYFNANVGLIKAECCPLREPSVSIHESLISLVEIGYLEMFIGSDGKRYGRVVTFEDHQRVNRPTASKIKPLCVASDTSFHTHTQLSEPSPPEGKGMEEEGKGMEDAPSGARDDAKRETPLPKPTAKSELMAVLDERHAEAFIEHRKKIKRPMTAHAANLLAKQFAQAPPPMTANDAADMTIANGWQGFRPEYVKNVDRSHNNNGQRAAPGVMEDIRDLTDRAKEFDDRRRESLRGDSEDPQRRVLGTT